MIPEYARHEVKERNRPPMCRLSHKELEKGCAFGREGVGPSGSAAARALKSAPLPVASPLPPPGNGTLPGPFPPTARRRWLPLSPACRLPLSSTLQVARANVAKVLKNPGA